MQASTKEIASIRMDATDSLEREVRALKDTTQMAVNDAGRYLLGLADVPLLFPPLYSSCSMSPRCSGLERTLVYLLSSTVLYQILKHY